MLILALPLISIIFKNKLGSFETDCRWQIFMKQKSLLLYLILIFCLFSCDSNKKPYKKKKNIKENKLY